MSEAHNAPTFQDTQPAEAADVAAPNAPADPAGALTYAKKRPNPLPKIFGYHEVFHLLVLIACAVLFEQAFDAVADAR